MISRPSSVQCVICDHKQESICVQDLYVVTCGVVFNFSESVSFAVVVKSCQLVCSFRL